MSTPSLQDKIAAALARKAATPQAERDAAGVVPQGIEPVASTVPHAEGVVPSLPVSSQGTPQPAKPALTPAQLALLRLKAHGVQPAQVASSTATAQPAPSVQPRSHLQELMQRVLAERKAANPAAQALATVLERKELAKAVASATEFQWNSEQLEAIELSTHGRGFVLVGAAGTGKTTCMRQVVVQSLQQYIQAGVKCKLACVAFTNRAVKNLRRACKGIEDAYTQGVALAACSTIHKLLKFAPVYYDYRDAQGNMQRTMRFEPTFTASNPLDLELVIIDEASMVDLPLWKMLLEATPNARYIFIGDLNQLKPVFGLSVLGYKLLELPVVELTQVYRQALESPILNFQHTYSLKGKAPSDTELRKITEGSGGKLTFFPLSKTRPPVEQARVLAQTMQKHYLAGQYKPYEDIILLPHGKDGTFGANTVNMWIAQWLGEERNAVVHEIACGMSKKYLAEGDFMVHNKEEYFIESIRRNHSYSGKQPLEPSTELMRTGFYKARANAPEQDLGQEFDDLLAQAFLDDGGERKLAASHIVTLVLAQGCSTVAEALALAEPDDLVTVTTKGELNELVFGYALTVHKSQGSEWRKVYLAATSHHLSQLNRELLYTAMTRAREELYVYYSPQSDVGCKDSTIAKAILRPSISGNNWREKCKHFADRVDEYKAFMAEPTQYGIEEAV